MTILVDSLETCVNTLRPSVEHRRADCMSRPVSPAEGIDLKFKCDSVFQCLCIQGKCNPPVGRIAA